MPIEGWLGPHSKETKLPLKYGDVLDAIRAELAPQPAEKLRTGASFSF